MQKRRAQTRLRFLPLPYQKVVAIACALRDDSGFKIASVGTAEDAEPELIRRFFDLHRQAHAATRVVERRRLRPAGAQLSRADPWRHGGQILGLGRRRPRVQVQQLPRPLPHAAPRPHGRAVDVPAARHCRTRRDGAAVRLSRQARDGRQRGRMRRSPRGSSTTSAAIAKPT